MPKINRPPKYCKDGKYAAVYLHGKKYRIGLHGSPESKIAFARLIAESNADPVFYPHKGKTNTSVREVAAAFLDYSEKTLQKPNYTHYRILDDDEQSKQTLMEWMGLGDTEARQRHLTENFWKWSRRGL